MGFNSTGVVYPDLNEKFKQVQFWIFKVWGKDFSLVQSFHLQKAIIWLYRAITEWTIQSPSYTVSVCKWT